MDNANPNLDFNLPVIPEEAQSPPIPSFHDLKALLEDMSEVISPFQLFLMGLVVGRTHGQVKLEDAVEMMVAVSIIGDDKEREEAEKDIIASGEFKGEIMDKG